MNGPTWIYRVKVWHPPVNSDADIDVSYHLDAEEARRKRNTWRDAGYQTEFASATVGDFYRLPSREEAPW